MAIMVRIKGVRIKGIVRIVLSEASAAPTSALSHRRDEWG
jgi:hypothetical protein